MKELISIQAELKAPKNQFNKFGGYAYRSVEDIMEAVKPLLKKYNCILTLSDDMVVLYNRVYVKATAKISNGKEFVETFAYAREAESQKGMAEAQITGSSSSYARKYALNGLFLIDDTKDDDFNNKHGKDVKPNVTVDNSRVIAQLAKCDNVDELEVLWENLTTSEKTTSKALFTKRKLELKQSTI